MTVFYLTDAIQCNNLHCHWRWYCPFILLHRFQQWTYYCERYPYKGQFSNLHCKKYFHFPLLKIHLKYIYMYVCGNVNGLQCFIRFFANKHKYDGRIILKWNTYRIYPPHLFLKLVLFCFLSNIHCNKTHSCLYIMYMYVCKLWWKRYLYLVASESYWRWRTDRRCHCVYLYQQKYIQPRVVTDLLRSVHCWELCSWTNHC